MLPKERMIFYLIVGICGVVLIILTVVGLVLQSQSAATVSLSSSLDSSSVLESSQVSELAQPVSPASSQEQSGVEGITLSVYQLSLTVGETQMPLVTMTPEDAPDKSEIWVSSDSTVAQVDGIGRITGVGAGSCVVTVTSAANPAVSASVEVEVSAGVTTVSSSNTSTSQSTASASTSSVTSETESTPESVPESSQESASESTSEPSQSEESVPEESTSSAPEEETVSQTVSE